MLAAGVRHTFSVFFPPILDEFGWSRGSTSVILSLHLLVFGIMAPFAGSLADRWQPKRLMHIGVIVLGVATVCCSLARELWHFYLLFGLMTPIGMSFCNLPLLNPALSNWFHTRLGLAIGLSQIGGGLSFVYGIFAQWMISALGWRNAYVAVGAMVILLLPLHYFFFFYHPKDKGLVPYDNGKKTTGSTSSLDSNKTVYCSWSFNDASRTPTLWLLFVSMLLWGMSLYLILAHQIKLAVDFGYSSMFAASIFALYGVFMIVGQFASTASDWIGREVTIIISMLLTILALVSLLLGGDAASPMYLYIYAICMGSGAGLYGPTLYAGTADIFHGSSYGSINGMILSGMGLGGAIGPWVGGYAYDIFGNYERAIIFAIAGFVVSAIAFILAGPRNAEKIRRRLASCQ